MHSQAYQMPLLQLSAETTFEKDDADLGSQSSPTQMANGVRSRHMSFFGFSVTKLELSFDSFLAL
jgi:hypothetical protein